jgi:hypothetical protein
MLAQTGGVDQFYTWATLGSLAGASAATLLVGNVAAYLSPGAAAAKKWIALAAALVLSFAFLVYGTPSQTAQDWILAFLNGLLIYSAAFGLNEAAVNSGSWKP